MKPPRDLKGRLSRNVPELIQHLRDLYSSMVLDPALEGTAKHINQAVKELEHARKLAWDVANEERANPLKRARSRPEKSRGQPCDDITEWLMAAKTASPLKQ
jgi:hypothetical protein